MTTQNNEMIERLTRLEEKIDRLLAEQAPTKPARVRRDNTSPEELAEMRKRCLMRTFKRYAEASFAFKGKNRFPNAVVQPMSVKTPWEIVPWSILVNRCETQRIFWPAADGSERIQARAIVERFLHQAIKDGELVKDTVANVIPHMQDFKSGDVVVLLSPAEVARRRDAEDDVGTAPAKPYAGGTSRPLKPWEDEEDWDEEAEDIQPPAPVKKPVVEIEGFRSPRAGVVLEGFGRKGGDE